MVFGPVQATENDAAVGVFLSGDGGIDFVGDPGGEGFEVSGGEGFLFFGRHFAEIEGVADIVPGFRGDPVFDEVGRECVEAEIALLLLLAVAFEAMLLEDGFDVLLEVESAEKGAGRKEQEEAEGLERGGDGKSTRRS